MRTKYAEELVKLYGLETRKRRATPDIGSDNYDSKELDGKCEQKFRSAMGTLLHLIPDRLDLQYAIRSFGHMLTKTCRTRAGLEATEGQSVLQG